MSCRAITDKRAAAALVKKRLEELVAPETIVVKAATMYAAFNKVAGRGNWWKIKHPTPALVILGKSPYGASSTERSKRSRKRVMDARAWLLEKAAPNAELNYPLLLEVR